MTTGARVESVTASSSTVVASVVDVIGAMDEQYERRGWGNILAAIHLLLYKRRTPHFLVIV